MPKRVTPEKEERIVNDYLLGIKVEEITKRNHCSLRTLIRIQRERKLHRKIFFDSLSEQQQQEIIKDYNDGLQVREIFKKYKISQPIFYLILRENKIARRNYYQAKNGKIRNLRARGTILDESAVLSAYLSGIALKDIYASWGATRADVSRILLLHGHEPNRSKRENEKRKQLYQKLLLQQKGRCAICHKKAPSRNSKEKAFALDHDHRSGKIRGVLCQFCNTALGLLGDSLPNLHAAIRYLMIAQTKQKKEINE